MARRLSHLTIQASDRCRGPFAVVVAVSDGRPPARRHDRPKRFSRGTPHDPGERCRGPFAVVAAVSDGRPPTCRHDGPNASRGTLNVAAFFAVAMRFGRNGRDDAPRRRPSERGAGAASSGGRSSRVEFLRCAGEWPRLSGGGCFRARNLGGVRDTLRAGASGHAMTARQNALPTVSHQLDVSTSRVTVHSTRRQSHTVPWALDLPTTGTRAHRSERPRTKQANVPRVVGSDDVRSLSDDLCVRRGDRRASEQLPETGCSPQAAQLGYCLPLISARWPRVDR